MPTLLFSESETSCEIFSFSLNMNNVNNSTGKKKPLDPSGLNRLRVEALRV